jgi:hypothetical protein
MRAIVAAKSGSRLAFQVFLAPPPDPSRVLDLADRLALISIRACSPSSRPAWSRSKS